MADEYEAMYGSFNIKDISLNQKHIGVTASFDIPRVLPVAPDRFDIKKHSNKVFK